jgi:hypothetical protein
MNTNALLRFSAWWSIGLLFVVVTSGFIMPHTPFLNTIPDGSKEGAKEALALLKDSTIWMASIQTATIAALGFLAKDGMPALRLNEIQAKLAVLVLLFNSFALFFSAWLLTALPSLLLRIYNDSLPDYDFFNLPLYGFMKQYPTFSGFTVHYFAFWNHWLWGVGIVLFGALSISMVVRQRNA